jgi:glycosyltransferase involved in cell wall biosynthesis
MSVAVSEPIASAKTLIRMALARPRSIVRALRSRKLRILVALVDRLPHRARAPLGRMASALGVRLAVRTSTASVGIPMHALGLRWGASEAAASAYALEMGRRVTTPVSAALRLVRVSRETGDRMTAIRILDALPEDAVEPPARLALRAEIDLALGRYQGALSAAQELLELNPDDIAARRTLDRARAELTVLDAEWRPALRPGTHRPTPTPGRILHLLTNALPYRQAGYTVRSQSVARCQREVGLDPHMATRAGFPANLGVHRAPLEAVIDGVPYHRLEPDLDPQTATDVNVTRYAQAAQRLVEELRPALLQPTSNHINAQVALALKDRFDVPVVYEVRGFQEESWLARFGPEVESSDRYADSRIVETACMRSADAIVTLSETMRQDIIGRGEIEPERIVVVPNAVELDRFVPGPRDERLAASLGIGDEPVIGYISTFWRYEGIDYLIEATAELKRRGRTLRCLLVGEGEVGAELEATAERLGLLADRTVIFTGRVPHDRVLDYYRLIDVFVVPRTNDRVSQLVTPLKPYEAMAMERALVVSGVDALTEIVADGDTGRSFAPEDASSLADVVDELLDDPATRTRLGQNAREWVGANRTWTANGRRYRELYERLGVA